MLKLIFLVGPHCSGKTTVADFLSRQGFTCMDTGPFLRRIYNQTRVSSAQTLSEWIQYNESKLGGHFTDDLICKEIERIRNSKQFDTNECPLTIIGHRTLSGIKHVVEKETSNGVSYKITYIDAPFEILYERSLHRDGDKYTKNEFKSMLDKEMRTLIELRAASDFHIMNTGDIKDLEGKILKIIR